MQQLEIPQDRINPDLPFCDELQWARKLNAPLLLEGKTLEKVWFCNFI
jgi:hypothetical protein